jgi:hypothetical protein
MMRNTKRPNNEPSRKKNDSRGLASKEDQAIEAAQVGKKANTSNARPRKRNMLTETNDENTDPRGSLTSKRRSARLNVTPATIPDINPNENEQQPLNKANESPVARKSANPAGSKPKPRPKGLHGLSSKHMDGNEPARADDNNAVSGTPVDRDAMLHGPGLLKEIHDLQRQLREERGESSSYIRMELLK